jgi:ATP-dependent Clp protease ATP-binding subunit ClpX
VSGEGVQQALLKIIEGNVVNVSCTGHRKTEADGFLQIDTSNILFICGGAFEGLDRIIEDRTKTKNSFGFNAEAEAVDDDTNVTTEDLVKAGMMPEFLGRLPIVAKLDQLTEEDLVRILTEPRNAIVEQYKQLVSFDGVELEFRKDALLEVAQIALRKNTGARGLRSILENILLDIRYELPSMPDVGKCVITKNTINTGKAIYRTVKSA